MDSRSYCLYGLTVRSPWRIPCPQARNGGKVADVDLCAGQAPFFARARGPAWATAPASRNSEWLQRTQLPDGSMYLQWRELFEFMISADGRRVQGRPLQKASLEAFQTYLLGQVLAHAMLRRGIESIHATALVVDGKAFALLGDCGFGKSTLAAACVRAGHRVLTDDLLIVKEQGGQLLAYPGPPRLKLFPRIARSLLGRQARGTAMNKLTRKLVIPLRADQSCRTAVPLKALYVLRPPSQRFAPTKVTIRTLTPRQAVISLVANTFNCTVRDSDRLGRQLSHAAQIAARVPIKTLCYPRELSRLAEVVDRVSADLAGGKVVSREA